jgi:hypothetical protein
MRALLACLACASLLCGCAWEGVPLFWWHKSALRDAQVLELYSLSAVSGSAGDQVKIAGHLHGHPVLGKAAVTDPARRERLVAAFEKAVADSRGDEPACFFPRHAIRTVRDGKTYDFVICFECIQVHAYGGWLSPHPYLVDKSAEPLFDEMLKEAKVVTSRELEGRFGSR